MIEKEVMEAAMADVADETLPEVKSFKQSPVYRLHVMTAGLIKISLSIAGAMVAINGVLSLLDKEQVAIGAFLGAVGGAVTAYAGKEIAKGIIEARNGNH
jgi:energy-converting hydrogenase Eha subunit A